jgi:hypothetical protein
MRSNMSSVFNQLKIVTFNAIFGFQLFYLQYKKYLRYT